MRYTIEVEQKRIQVETDGRTDTFDLYSPEGFAALSRLWLTVGWSLGALSPQLSSCYKPELCPPHSPLNQPAMPISRRVRPLSTEF